MGSVLVIHDRAYRQTYQGAAAKLGSTYAVDSIETAVALCARVKPEVAIIEARVCGCDETDVAVCVYRLRQAGAAAVVLVAHDFGEFQQELLVGEERAIAYVSGFGGGEMRLMILSIQALLHRRELSSERPACRRFSA
jgi:hypothetical protein